MTDIETPASSIPGPRQSSPDRRRRMGSILGAVALLLAVVVVGWLLSRDTNPTPPSTEPVQSPTPSGPTLNTGESASSAADFEVIYKGLEATRNRAYREYNSELLADVYGPDCPAACGVDRTKKAIEEMGVAGARFSEDQARVLDVQIVGVFSGAILEDAPRRMVTVRVIDEGAPFHVIRRDGSQGVSHPGWKPTSRTYDLYFSPAKKHWLINNRFVEGPVEGLPALTPGNPE